MRSAFFACIVTLTLCAPTFVAGSGCVKHLGEESLHRDRLGEVTGDCVVPRPMDLASWGAPLGLEYPDGSLWIWNQVQTGEGTALRQVAAWVPSIEGACAGELDWHRGPGDALEPILALTAEEEVDNTARTDGTRWELVATGGFVHGGRGYLYYEKVLGGPGLFDALPVGSGLCVIESGGRICERSAPGGVPGEPTLLFGGGVRRPNQGGYVASDGYAYLYGCLRAAAFTDLCGLWRVRPEDALSRPAYEVRGAFGDWVSDPAGAETLFESSGAITAAPSEALSEVLVVSANIWDATLEARVAPYPWGSFGTPQRMAALVAPSEWFIDGGRLHAGLGQEAGRVLALSYYTSAQGAAEGLHVITYRLAGGE